MNRTYEQQRTAAEKITDAAVKERVLRGLDVVRAEYGEDWVDHINPETLDLADSYRCVLGQLESSHSGHEYHYALRRIDGDVEADPHHYGFDIAAVAKLGSYGGSYAGYDELEDAWLTVIGAA